MRCRHHYGEYIFPCRQTSIRFGLTYYVRSALLSNFQRNSRSSITLFFACTFLFQNMFWMLEDALIIPLLTGRRWTYFAILLMYRDIRNWKILRLRVNAEYRTIEALYELWLRDNKNLDIYYMYVCTTVCKYILEKAWCAAYNQSAIQLSISGLALWYPLLTGHQSRALPPKYVHNRKRVATELSERQTNGKMPIRRQTLKCGTSGVFRLPDRNSNLFR